MKGVTAAILVLVAIADSRVIARAPGRVNLIGDHTDYNDGFVLPMALPFETTMTVSPNETQTVSLTSEGYGQVTFALEDDLASIEPWARYVAAMARFLADDGIDVSGFRASIATTIPVGASLSSSAALEVATGFALTALSGATNDCKRIARLGQRVENEVVGIQSGIMDQLISACATAGSATLIDCRSLELTAVPVPTGATVLIMDTLTRRELASSEYDNRRHACERAAAELGVGTLRDASVDDLARVSNDVDRRRARHVVTENQRVLDAVEAMRSDDPESLGSLMDESHRSLSEDFEVSSAALDQISGYARKAPGCFGARMTGGGFAGCAVALIDIGSADAITRHVTESYKSASGVTPELWVVEPSRGASVTIVD